MNEQTRNGENAAVDERRIVDLFAGARGWSEGLRMLGLRDLGMEKDQAACRTAVAAGHATIRADLNDYPPAPFAGRVWGLIASPPCGDWSTAGGMLRREGESGHLVDLVPEWVRVTTPEWIACEQVPQVLPVWEEHATIYRSLGYSVWTGILDAADFGVPQNRLRAILLASNVRQPFPPTPTHTTGSEHTLFGTLEPANTLADLLGLEPGWHYDSGQNSRAAGGGLERYRRSCDRPSGTLTTKCTSQWVLRKGDERRKITTLDALELQTFRRDYPLRGNTTEQQTQVGNAIPPLFASHVLSAVVGCGQPAERLVLSDSRPSDG